MTLPSPDVNLAWLSQDMIQTLGWTLIHFLWEGLALVLAFQFLATFCRTAHDRYTLAFATLMAMAVAPVITYVALGAADAGSDGNDIPDMAADISRSAAAAVNAFTATSAPTSPWLNWLVVLWLAGVALLSLRVVGGWYVADSLRRRDVTPLPPALRARFERLRIRLGISRPVQFLQSAIVNAPAVVGWLRPVILIPVSAVIGLTQAQLEAVIIHELAHIRRLDALANVMQMAVETVLFYHPAVWWISRRVRIEREHCCDDVAVSMSGDAFEFAKALASLEEWRTLSSPLALPMLAANGGVLKHRISRLLGLNIRTSSVSVMGVAGVGLVCLIGSVVAHGAGTDANAAAVSPFPGLAAMAGEPVPKALPSIAPILVSPPVSVALPSMADIQIRVPIAGRLQEISRDRGDTDNDDGLQERMDELQHELRSELAREQADLTREQVQEARERVDEARDRLREQARDHMRELELGRSRHSEASIQPEDASYIKSLEDAGLKGLDADEAVRLKALGVTADYVRDMNASGYHTSVRQLLTFKSQGLDAAYIKDVRAAGIDPSAPQLLALRAQGVSAAFIRDIHAVWPDAGAAPIIALHVRGVTPEYVKSVRANWPDISLNDMIAMSTLGVSTSDAAEFRKSGVPGLSVKQIFSYKTLGVTPEFVRALKAAGVADLSPGDYTTAKVRGITPEFLAAVRKHGFSNLSMRQLIALKDADVL
ncbi:MAG: M56 family metallopeptidase [Rhodospirillaceae bacterium]